MAVTALKQRIKPYIPPSVFPVYDQVRHAIGLSETTRARFERFRNSVPLAIKSIRSLTPRQCSDVHFLEHEFIPSLGLNNEGLTEQPGELGPYFGTGIHLWQYPNQLAGYLVWLGSNGKAINRYLEIGCRWGGMFILTVEWLRKVGAEIKSAITIDPIDLSPLIDEYFKFLRNEGDQIGELYLHASSTSTEAISLVKRTKPDLVFIDGDHSLRGALADHMLVRGFASIVVHHDVASDSCPETKELWNILKILERNDFNFFEFIEQYGSVDRSYLGIGVMQRKT
jgi:hypothetical protein